MISASDLQSLREAFEASDNPLPVSVCADFALLLGVSEVSISLFSTAHQFTICASSAEARLLGEWAFTFQEGPAPGAPDTMTYCVADTATGSTSRWPRLAAKAHEMGYRSLASIPLRHGEAAVGTIQLQDRDGSIGTETLDDADLVAKELVALLLKLCARQSRAIHRLVDRHEFHQATGMVMRKFGIASAPATAMLRAYAWANDLTLLDVAQSVVSRELELPNSMTT
jgi:hypothetical protein